jgi:hypothetical protein
MEDLHNLYSKPFSTLIWSGVYWKLQGVRIFVRLAAFINPTCVQPAGDLANRFADVRIDVGADVALRIRRNDPKSAKPVDPTL